MWTRIVVKVSPEAAAGVADILLGFARGLEQRTRDSEVRLIAYMTADQDLSRALERIRERLEALRAAGLHVGKGSITARRIRSQPWEQQWKAGLGVVKVPPRLAIKPTWKDYVPAPDEVVVELDPGMAFGTGHHATTRGCLAALARIVRSGAIVFDIGAGSGILSIAAAKLGARRVVAVEVDESAARVARDNVFLNRVAGAVSVVCGSGLRCLRGRADVIVANLTAEQIAALAPQAAGSLRPGGMFVTAGITAGRAADVVAAATEAGMTVREREEQEEWVTITLEVGTNAPAVR